MGQLAREFNEVAHIFAKRAKAPEQVEGTPVHYCSLPAFSPPAYSADVSVQRAQILAVMSNKWANGTTLRYYFFTEQDRDGKMVTFARSTVFSSGRQRTGGAASSAMAPF